ncbi:recombinase family protein [Pseudomonas aeruginosa]|jgi:DNA invertase Pin-like site-specific DNA recombinase|uniref:recombinase family protein n=1 Tax=Pseudomonas aeruginosa TaxID=287 RepID=UPI00086AA116|nr:recombinase family protein [Pseudomonas aeruginosa]ODS96830.1 MAG: recombinase [Lautropia sp. SCN 69-89]PBX74719.1 recombinase [Pseudomonas aeruginosa]HBN8310279.1 recombinase family protein [Pseudomonas aeruginosa]HCI2895125.1 recombinase family protein [Pseudomonas aeruginosa]
MSIAILASPKRCAVYCRVSSDERLDQSFNSIDAQKEAGHAFIKSQTHEGWIAVADDYDDGGFSGGNMDRPALKRLLADIEAGRIDIVVVYKIDRLSRSLADFARMVEVFDRCGVSFSAVTQQINSATSMGRLMLNVLLSFAQFEREVTGERIRDKIAASKAKGMWMGGPLPLGYDVQNRLLVVNEAEATVVRRIFADFARDRSTTHMVRNYAAEGIRTKTGRTFCKQSIYKLLHNRMYLGEIVHKGRYYPGQHPPILTRAQWQAAHDVLAQTAEERRAAVATDGRGLPLLRGLIFTTSGERLIPTRTTKKGQCYRYYTPAKDRHYGAGASNFGSLPAESIEALVVEQVCQVLRAPESVQAVWDRVRESGLDLDQARVVVPMRQLAAVWPSLFPAEQRRLAQLLIERVLIGNDGLEILWRDAGWVELIDELRPNSIGAELAEVEMTV